MQSVAGASVRAAKLATRERIIECARKLFSRDGYEATSIRAIARAAGMSDAAIHYHFHSKQELLSAVLESQACLAVRAARHRGACATRACLVDCLLDFFFTYVGLPGLMRMLLREQIVNEPTSMAAGTRIADHFVESLGPAFRGLYGEGGGVLVDAVDMLLTGVLWHEILESPDEFSRAVASAAFRKRVRGLIEFVLPQVPGNRVAAR